MSARSGSGAPPLRAWKYLSRAISPNWSGYYRRSRVETKMHCVKLLGQLLTARDFDRQVAEFEFRIAVLNGYTAVGIPVAEAVGSVCPRKREPRPSADLCKRVWKDLNPTVDLRSDRDLSGRGVCHARPLRRVRRLSLLWQPDLRRVHRERHHRQ